MSWEERMAQRTREREAAKPQLVYLDPCRVRYDADGAILYPAGRVVCPRCGVEIPAEYVDEHDCPADVGTAFVPCACVGADFYCCVARYHRNQRYLHQKAANLFRAALENGILQR